MPPIGPPRPLTSHPRHLAVGQCIGRRNYRYFLGFVISVCVLALYVAGFSALMAMRAASRAYAGGHKPPFIDLVEKARPDCVDLHYCTPYC